jgi:hypothetical protein
MSSNGYGEDVGSVVLLEHVAGSGSPGTRI